MSRFDLERATAEDWPTGQHVGARHGPNGAKRVDVEPFDANARSNESRIQILAAHDRTRCHGPACVFMETAPAVARTIWFPVRERPGGRSPLHIPLHRMPRDWASCGRAH